MEEMKNCKTNKDGLYVMKVPAFTWEFDENEKNILDDYWIRRSGHTFDEMIALGDGKAAAIAYHLIDVAMAALEKQSDQKDKE